MSKPEEVTLYWPRELLFWKPKAKYAQGHLLNEKREGRWLFWYRNGQKQLEGEYVAGRKNGLWIKWDESGARVTEGTFLHDKMHGVWTDWYLNGKKAQESHWFQGRRDGKWIQWSKDGQVESSMTYDHRQETDKGYSLYTDREARALVQTIHRNALHRHWEMMVGKSIAGMVRPWHIACWMLFFVISFALIKAGTPWRGAAFAAIVALAITSVIAWTVESKKDD